MIVVLDKKDEKKADDDKETNKDSSNFSGRL